MTWTLHEGDCLKVLASIPDGTVDSVITDPPYPEIDREYGRWTEEEWWALMVDGVIPHVRRVLNPTGSAVFILQPNSCKVGSMRGWLFRFQAWVCDNWNMVQDVHWWNVSSPPTVHCHAENGLMRPSLKACVWMGDPRCYRNQNLTLLPIADSVLNDSRINRHDLDRHPSGLSMRKGRALQRCRDRGGSTPFNVLVVSSGDSQNGAGAHGHGAGTPLALLRWWTRYICPPDGTILDPFAGSGTAGVAAHMGGRHSIMIERVPKYCDIIRKRMAEAEAKTATPLFDTKGAP